MSWKLNREAYQPGFVTSEHEITAMRPNDVARNREAEPASSLLGSKQRFEDALDGFLCDWAGWIDHVYAYCRIAVFFCFEINPVALATGIDRIQHQIQKRLLDLARVKVAFQVTLGANTDSNAFITCMSTRNSGNVVEH